MALYDIIWKMLAWSFSVALLWPLMFPWGTVAYKIWHGNKAIDEEVADELWWRSAYASGALFVVTPIFIVLDYACADPEWLGMPAGPVHVLFYLCFVSVAAFIMYYCYSMEDFFQGLSMAVIFIYIPVAVLFMFGNWTIVYPYVLSWLIEPKA